MDVDEKQAFECPRCHKPAEERFYGACHDCRNELRASMRLEAREIAVDSYTPKMNVVPNQVALKDD